MKMLVVVLRDEDSEAVLEALIEGAFGVTQIASTGGFFRRGNTTLIIGTEDERVEQAMEVVAANTSPADDPSQRRATVFVLPVADFKKI